MSEDFCQWCYDRGIRYSRPGPWAHAKDCPNNPNPVKPIEVRICEFVDNPENQMDALALMKVARDHGDSAEEIMRKILFSALMKFHRIPLKTGDS